MIPWVNPFNNSQVPTTTSSVVNYTVASTPFSLTWAWTGGSNPIAYNTILTTSTANNVVMMPPVASGTIGFATFIWNNSTTHSMALQDAAGNSLGTLPEQSISSVVLNNIGTESASNWAFKQLNVTVGSIVDPSTIAGDGLGVADSLLYVDWTYNEINLADSPYISPWSMPSWTANGLYVFRFTPGTVILPSAAGGDVGKMNIFKNLTNGSIFINVPSGSYEIDINITVQNSDVIGSGLSTITLLPNESVGINYCGQVTLISPTTAFMYSIVTKVSNSSALLQQSVILLPTTPPVTQPIVLDVNTTVADIIFITDADPALPASGGYTYIVPYPISKVYYFAMETVNPSVSVTIYFGIVSAPTSFSITPLIGLVECFVASDGTVLLANGGGGASQYALATQTQVNAGLSTDTIVAPSTLQGKYVDIYDNLSTHTVEIIGSGGLSVTDSSVIPTLSYRSVVTTPATNNTNPAALALIGDTLLGNRFQLYNIAGTYTFTVPAGITQLYITASGSGGGGGSGSGSNGGGGSAGAAIFKALYTVTPGDILTIVVGAGGLGGTSGLGGNNGNATTITALSLSLLGGVGGLVGISGPGNGGDARPGGSAGTTGTSTTAGSGGANVAGGIGANTNVAAGKPGYQGGGGSGGEYNGLNQPGGDGGDGLMLIEW